MIGRWKRCGGCKGMIGGKEPRLVCQYASSGFLWENGAPCQPCGTAYHRDCLRVGSPFTSRRRGGAGLVFPAVLHWPAFICECCTVRMVLGRELGAPGDKWLLQLERMRMLDVAHAWASGTYSTYRSKLNYLASFQQQHPGMRLMGTDKAAHPPSPRSIPLMWAELDYSVKGRPKNKEERHIAFGTIRQLRSAAAHHWGLGWLITRAGEVVLDPGTDQLRIDEIRASDEATMTYFTRGLSARIGTASKPAVPLLERHVKALDALLEKEWTSANGLSRKLELTRAALANLFLWLGWLRASELFGLRICDITIIRPQEGQMHDLPRGVGALLLRLAPETKSQRGFAVDVPLAYATKAGFKPGLWMERFLASHHGVVCPEEDPTPIFQDTKGRPWDSALYREQYLYPLLYSLQMNGDAHLGPYGGPDGLGIPSKFYSLHCYRRGSRSHVARLRGESHRRLATLDEIYEHARWMRKRSGEAVDLLYKELPLYDRLAITLLCM